MFDSTTNVHGRLDRVATAISLLLAATIPAPVAAQPPTYSVVFLGPAGLDPSEAIDIDPTGTYVAGQGIFAGKSRGFLWHAGTVTDIGHLGAGHSTASGVNASGRVVGLSHTAGGSQRAVSFSGGVLTDLGILPGGRYAHANGINAAGLIVGAGDIASRNNAPARWSPGTTNAVRIADDSVGNSIANDVNAAGVIVGSATIGGQPRAVSWSGAVMTDLGVIPGGGNSLASRINGAGQVVGYSGVPGSAARRAVLFENGTVVNLGTLLSDDDRVEARDINDGGQVVGFARSLSRPGPNRERAFLWQQGTMYDLNSRLDASGAGLIVTHASGISNDGKIAARACPVSGAACRAALLVPAAGPQPPDPSFTRYLAEGATSAFFDTQIALLNPGTLPATARLRYLSGTGAAIDQDVPVPGRTRVTVRPKDLPGLASAEFSTVVQSDREIVVDRTMWWDGNGYGSHSETAVRAPSTVWYLAEGATIAGFSCFYLLQNPTDAATTVRVRYLRASGVPLEKTYGLGPRSRSNIWVNVEEFPGLGRALENAEFSGIVESLDGTPIIVERAMYRSNQGRTFNAGHESTAVSAPATEWFMAEGATGDFFDLFVLIANPNPTDSQVTLTYLTVDGTTYSRSMVAPANSRSGVWVDMEQFDGIPGYPLANAAVSTTVRSTNGVPLVVERAMWWPGNGDTWHEAHNSAGATTTGTRWAVAEGEIGGARGHETYLLIANTSVSAGSATVTLMFEDGTSTSRIYALPASSRTNVAVGPDFGAAVTGKRFGALVESTGTTPVQIVVERAMYSSAGGQSFAAGTNALATRLQ